MYFYKEPDRSSITVPLVPVSRSQDLEVYVRVTMAGFEHVADVINTYETRSDFIEPKLLGL